MTIDDVDLTRVKGHWTLWARFKKFPDHWEILRAHPPDQVKAVKAELKRTDRTDQLEYLLLPPGELPILVDVESEPDIGEAGA